MYTEGEGEGEGAEHQYECNIFGHTSNMLMQCASTPTTAYLYTSESTSLQDATVPMQVRLVRHAQGLAGHRDALDALFAQVTDIFAVLSSSHCPLRSTRCVVETDAVHTRAKHLYARTLQKIEEAQVHVDACLAAQDEQAQIPDSFFIQHMTRVDRDGTLAFQALAALATPGVVQHLFELPDNVWVIAIFVLMNDDDEARRAVGCGLFGVCGHCACFDKTLQMYTIILACKKGRVNVLKTILDMHIATPRDCTHAKYNFPEEDMWPTQTTAIFSFEEVIEFVVTPEHEHADIVCEVINHVDSLRRYEQPFLGLDLVPFSDTLGTFAVNRVMQRAILFGHLNTVTALLADPRCHCSPRAKAPEDEDGVTERIDFYVDFNGAVKLAVDVGGGRMDILKTLFADPRVDVSVDNNYAITRAIELGRADIVRELLLLRAPHSQRPVDPSIGFRQVYFTYAIGRARADGFDDVDTDVLRELLADPLARVDFVANGTWVLQAAARHGNMGTVALLLADPRINPAADNNNALRMALEQGHVEVLEALLADPSVSPPSLNQAAIDLATRNGYASVVARLYSDPRMSTLFKIRRCIQKHPAAAFMTIGTCVGTVLGVITALSLDKGIAVVIGGGIGAVIGFLLGLASF